MFGGFTDPFNLWNALYDKTDQKNEAVRTYNIESLRSIEALMDTEFEHIAEMHSIMMDKQERITAIFNYYQEMANGFNTIMALLLGISIPLFEPYIHREDAKYLEWWALLWFGSLLFGLIAIIEGVFISVRLSFAGAEFIEGDLREQLYGRWVRQYNVNKLSSLSTIVQGMLFCFLFSMGLLIAGLHLMFYQNHGDAYDLHVIISAIVVTLFFIIRFFSNYGFLLNIRWLNIFQQKLGIPTNTDKLNKPLIKMIEEYNSTQEEMACLQQLWEEDQAKWIGTILCQEGKDCTTTLMELSSTIDKWSLTLTGRTDINNVNKKTAVNVMNSIARKLKFHNWRLKRLFNNPEADDVVELDDVEVIEPWNISYMSFYVATAVGMILLFFINIAWAISLFSLILVVYSTVGVVAVIINVLRLPCNNFEFKTDGLIRSLMWGKWINMNTDLLFNTFCCCFWCSRKRKERLRELRAPTEYDDDDINNSSACDDIKREIEGKVDTLGYKRNLNF